MSNSFKKDIKKNKAPQKPDQAVLRKAVNEVDLSINKIKERLDAVSKEIDSALNGKDSNDPRTELRKKLNLLRDEQATLKGSKQKIFDSISNIQATLKKKQTDLKALQTKLHFKTVEEMIAHINKLEKQVESGKLKIIEEKKILNEISQLNRNKKSFDALLELEIGVNEDRDKLDKLRSQIDEERVKAINKEYEEIKGQLDELNSTAQDSKDKKSELFSKRDAIRKELDAQYDKKRTLNTDFKKATDDYYNWRRDTQKEREEQALERKKQEEKEKFLELVAEERANAEIPAYEAEIAQCTTLLGYFQRLIGSTDPSSKSNSSDPTSPSATTSNIRKVDESNVPEGVALVKKSDRDEPYYASTKPKKNSKKPASKSQSKGTFTIPLAIMDSLWSLKINAPTSQADVPNLITAITEKRQFYKDDQEKATAEKKAKAEAKIKALSAKFELENKADEKPATAAEASAAPIEAN